jgi:hypothetical protein
VVRALELVLRDLDDLTRAGQLLLAVLAGAQDGEQAAALRARLLASLPAGGLPPVGDQPRQP